jgi:DNA-binding MarR family transcriptional regulator
MGVKEQILVSDGRRRSGWFWVDNEVFEMNLDPSAFMVYCFLIRIADRSSEVACISLRKLERFLGLSRNTIIKAINKLEELRMIKKVPRKAEKGNNLANLYCLTSKEEWLHPESGEVVQKMNHGGSKNEPGVVQKMSRGGSKNEPPPNPKSEETVERQRVDEQTSLPINTTIDQKCTQDQKYLDHHHHRSGGGDEVDTSDVYRKLLEKWRDVLEGLELKRLSKAQVIFFLENSALPAEQTLETVLRDDRDPKVRNPVGTLCSTLPLKSNKYRWLLKMVEPPSVEDEPWYKRYKEKLSMIREYFKIPAETRAETEEEANKHLKRLESVVLERIWKELSAEERERFRKEAKRIMGGNATLPKHMEKSVLMSLILKERKLPDMFSLYTY